MSLFQLYLTEQQTRYPQMCFVGTYLWSFRLTMNVEVTKIWGFKSASAAAAGAAIAIDMETPLSTRLQSRWCHKINRIRSKPLRADLGASKDKI